MPRLILSDIHSNLDALQAVLQHASGSYDDIICCGDVVGYNAAPAEVVDWVRRNVRLIVRGNHDRACCGLDSADWFNPIARAASQWTSNALSEADRDWLRKLPSGPIRDEDFELSHGSPAGEDDYLVDANDLQGLDLYLVRRMSFVGHTHIQNAWNWQRGGILTLPKPGMYEEERIIELEPNVFYLINPGAVGQPRDGDPRAAYALWDDTRNLLHLRRVPYDVGAAQQRIRRSGLPDALAERLASGR